MLNRTHPFVAILHLPTSLSPCFSIRFTDRGHRFRFGRDWLLGDCPGQLGGPPGEIVGDIVFVARAKTYEFLNFVIGPTRLGSLTRLAPLQENTHSDSCVGPCWVGGPTQSPQGCRSSGAT